MANLLEANAQNLLGAVSPVLVWQGAQGQGHDHHGSARDRPLVSVVWKEFSHDTPEQRQAEQARSAAMGNDLHSGPRGPHCVGKPHRSAWLPPMVGADLF